MQHILPAHDSAAARVTMQTTSDRDDPSSLPREPQGHRVCQEAMRAATMETGRPVKAAKRMDLFAVPPLSGSSIVPLAGTP